MLAEESHKHGVEVVQEKGCMCFGKQSWRDGPPKLFGVQIILPWSPNASRGTVGFGFGFVSFQSYFGSLLCSKSPFWNGNVNSVPLFIGVM